MADTDAVITESSTHRRRVRSVERWFSEAVALLGLGSSTAGTVAMTLGELLTDDPGWVKLDEADGPKLAAQVVLDLVLAGPAGEAALAILRRAVAVRDGRCGQTWVSRERAAFGFLRAAMVLDPGIA